MHPHRAIGILAVLQVFAVVVSLLVVTAILKINGYAEYKHVAYFRWNPAAVFIRGHGLWLLLVPICWTAGALRMVSRPAWTGRGWTWLAVGAALFVALVWVTVWAAANPFKRGFYISP